MWLSSLMLNVVHCAIVVDKRVGKSSIRMPKTPSSVAT